MDARTLHQLFLKQGVVCTDSRAIQEGCIFFALSGEHFNGNQFAKQALKNGATYAVIDDEHYIEQEHKEAYILVSDSLTALQELATTHRDYCNTPVIALTGSNGKTTTKELIYQVLKSKYNTLATKGNFNNHIGVPLTLLKLKKETEIAIIEMGANHLKEIEALSKIAKPNYGYITNFGLAHLEGFGSKEGVIKGKSELYTYLKKNQGSIFYNPEDEKQVALLKDHSKTIKCPKEKLSLNDKSDYIRVTYKNKSINSNLIGTYNKSNISAAIGIGEHFNIPLEDIKKAIESYQPKNNRSQKIETTTNTIILDAYNANPSSMKAALENLNNTSTTKEKVIILGDMLELGAYSKQAHQEVSEIALSITDKVYLVGTDFKQLGLDNSFKDTKAISNYLKANPITNSYILIKGSRGITLETLTDQL